MLGWGRWKGLTPMYEYSKERPKVLTEDGVTKLLEVYSAVLNRQDPGKPISAGEVLNKVCGVSWTVFACLDFLREKRFVHEMYTDPETTIGQNRMFRS